MNVGKLLLGCRFFNLPHHLLNFGILNAVSFEHLCIIDIGYHFFRCPLRSFKKCLFIEIILRITKFICIIAEGRNRHIGKHLRIACIGKRFQFVSIVLCLIGGDIIFFEYRIYILIAHFSIGHLDRHSSRLGKIVTAFIEPKFLGIPAQSLGINIRVRLAEFFKLKPCLIIRIRLVIVLRTLEIAIKLCRRIDIRHTLGERII